MDINRSNVDAWKHDIERSVDFYNAWFLEFAPKTFKDARRVALKDVKKVFRLLGEGVSIGREVLDSDVQVLPVLRQMTCPPLARDRLAGLAKVSTAVVKQLEENAGVGRQGGGAEAVMSVINRLLDIDLFPWIGDAPKKCSSTQKTRAALIVADRLCGALTDPLIRNEQEKRQLRSISSWLNSRGYKFVKVSSYTALNPGEYAFHLNIKVSLADGQEPTVNIPVDVAIQPLGASKGTLPLIIEAKSAGDFTNVNKRRKEEAQKIAQLKRTYGNVVFVLFLCGYFDAGYLGYEASEGIDWIWEHRIGDMEKLGL